MFQTYFISNNSSPVDSIYPKSWHEQSKKSSSTNSVSMYRKRMSFGHRKHHLAKDFPIPTVGLSRLTPSVPFNGLSSLSDRNPCSGDGASIWILPTTAQTLLVFFKGWRPQSRGVYLFIYLFFWFLFWCLQWGLGWFWSERGLRVRETRENREFGQSCPLNQTEFNELGFCSCKPSSLNSIYMYENWV